MVIVCLLAISALPAQDQNQPPNPAIPTVTFDLFWEQATPQSYTITMDGMGAAHYVSRNPTRASTLITAPTYDPEYETLFTMSGKNRDRIFELARELDYFHGDFDYRQHKIANTGTKTLRYADAIRNFSTTYNWSENKSIQELTSLFQGVSNTLQYGQKLQFKRRFDKLGLEAELKTMEAQAQNKELAELQVIAPILQNIGNDASVLHIARERAKRLLAQAGQAKD